MLFAAFATGDRISLANPNPPHSHSPANSIQLGQELDTLQRIPDDQRSPQQQKRLIELIHQQKVDQNIPTFIENRPFEKFLKALHSPTCPPNLKSSNTQSPPILGDLGGECKERNTFQKASSLGTVYFDGKWFLGESP